MRNFSKKLAFVLAAAMVFTAFAPAAKADAAEKMVMNRASQTLYVNEGVNDKGAETLPEGLYGNVQEYDFYVKNKPANYAKELKFAWESSDEKVATVDNKGLTKAVAVGTATITCTITDKATGDEVAEATAKVTVKANAADVVITNAEDYDNLPVPEDGVVDLNRAMYDENDNKTTKRGKVVTDYTRWIAEDADGEAVDATVVAIDQATGKFTFAADAPAGDYALYCQTYQSDKYNQRTAESEKVTVTVVEEDKTFEVVQNSTTKITLNFNNPVNALTINDVKVIRNLQTSAGSYPYPQTLKNVVLAKDKMSATVEIFQTMGDKVNYTIQVAGYEDYVLTASNGKPVRMELKAKDMTPSVLVYTGNPTQIEYVLYDAKNVQVSLADGEKVRLTLDRNASSKEVSFSGDKLTIRKNTATATVTATYQGYKQDGKFVGDFTTSELFLAEDAPEVVPVSAFRVGLSNPNGISWDTTSFQKKDNPTLYVNVADSRDGNDWNVNYSNGTAFDENKNGGKNKIVFEAMNPEICVINGAGVLTGIKPGVAKFYVKYEYVDNNKQTQSYPFDEITIEVLADSYVDYVTISDSSKTVGTAAGYAEADIFLLGNDQYQSRTNLNAVGGITIKCLTEFEDGVKTSLKNKLEGNIKKEGAYWNDGSGKDAAKITLKAAELRNILVDAGEMSTATDDGECISIDFEATYDAGWAGKKTVEFTVTIQEPSGEKDDDVIDIVTSGAQKDVMRKWSSYDNNAKAEKEIQFWVNWMNNDVQVDTQSVTKFNADNAAEDVYQVKVLKNGEDITKSDYVVVSGSAVTVKPSYVAPFGTRVQKAVSGGSVAYNVLGEGVYTLELYKWTADGTEFVESLEGTADISVTVGNAGAYTTDLENLRESKVKISAAATGDDYNTDDAEAILKCFLIKNTEGKDIVNPYTAKIENLGDGKDYFVDYTAVADTGTVYVKEIVFYEPVGTNEYVAYTVAIDKALVWDK